MLIYPEYDHSPVSIMASILKYFGVNGDYPALPVLEKAFGKKPKHVALIIFDGLGEAQLNRYLPDSSFLRVHRAEIIKTVFPPTTVAAMNTYYSGLPPVRHGWLGWSLYFKEVGRAIDIFPKVDSVTKQKLSGSFNPWQILAYKPLLDMIAETVHDGIKTSVSFVAPQGIVIPGCQSESVSVSGIGSFFETIERRLHEGCGSSSGTFTMAYWPDPDMTLHKKGCGSEDVFTIVRDIDSRCSSLVKTCSEDTLILFSADHGHIDVNRYVDISAINGLTDCMIMPPFLETRSALFFIKQEKRQKFEDIFHHSLSNEFALFPRSEILSRELFGPISEKLPAHPKTDDFIADYLITAIGQRALKYYEPDHDHSHDFASHHAGMTLDEMCIPLIVWPTL